MTRSQKIAILHLRPELHKEDAHDPRQIRATKYLYDKGVYVGYESWRIGVRGAMKLLYTNATKHNRS